MRHDLCVRLAKREHAAKWGDVVRDLDEAREAAVRHHSRDYILRFPVYESKWQGVPGSRGRHPHSGAGGSRIVPMPESASRSAPQKPAPQNQLQKLG